MGVRERYEQRQKEGKSSDYSGVKQRYMAKEIENVGSSITNRVNTWLKNHNTYEVFGQTRFSERGDGASNRHLLANAFEGLSRSSAEYQMIQDYKEQIKVLNLLDEQLSDLNAEIREIRFTKGKYDAEKLRKIEEKAERIARDIGKQDKVLIRMEASEPLRKIIAFERKKAAQKTKDHVKEIQENKKVRAEQTELRHKIRKAIRDLDKILNRGNIKFSKHSSVSETPFGTFQNSSKSSNK